MTCNVPNSLTFLRILLTLVLIVIYPLEMYAVCLAIFLVASITDFFDGWWARRFNQVTVFGRIADPFADKFLVCTLFIFFAATDDISKFIMPWMAVVIVARELLVTSLRAAIENAGSDFSARWIGKWKMVLQCVTIIAAFLFLIFGESKDTLAGHATFLTMLKLTLILTLAAWGAVLLTLYSGIEYTMRAFQIIAQKENSQKNCETEKEK